MTKNLAQYRQLEKRLWMTRWRYQGEESAEEDTTLDEMENTWMNLSEDERVLLRSEGPRCWPMDPSSWPPQLAGTPQVSAPKPWSYEGFRSPPRMRGYQRRSSWLVSRKLCIVCSSARTDRNRTEDSNFNHGARYMMRWERVTTSVG